MSPEDFIRKHITAALMAEGFSESAAGGGLSTASIITGEAHRQAGKVRFSMIVFFAQGNGLSPRPPAQSEKQPRKSRVGQRGPNQACSDCCYAKRFKSTWRGKFMKNLSRQSDYKSSAGELNVSRNGRH
ncbi:hypothetical protein FMJ60_22210 [Klebsiella quasipneumoniae]|uniref:hypothetical protein n=1 Tax=Klebsiella quasipneumoniae TaxID=1463165 RepID=UPI001CCD5DD9|nr:hypothetical protein [Klebsiella quasipneumoniae]MBZ6709516.1 hypothetical protein [Klebsiella quasipneumoniae]